MKIMFSTKFDWNREECRGILRRLELDSYSKVVSTFRAQGNLNDVKKKVLEDLREVLHISQDRHRAEVRRVTTDEKLTTIAEVICGPNTSQEWRVEGRREIPILPRQIPYTAFYSIANAMAEKAIQDDLKLISGNKILQNDNHIREVEIEQNYFKVPIVKEDPVREFLQERREISKNLPLQEHLRIATEVISSRQRKRMSSSQSNKFDEQNQIHTNVRIQQLYHNHSKTVSRHKKSTKRKLIHFNKEANVQSTSVQNTQSNIKGTTINDILESSTSDSILNINVPNPQTLHTYASSPQNKILVQNSRYTETKSLVQQYDGIESSSSKLTKNFQILPKKDVSNNFSKLNLSQLKKPPEGKRKLIVHDNTVEKPLTKNISSSLNVSDNTSLPISSPSIQSPPVNDSEVVVKSITEEETNKIKSVELSPLLEESSIQTSFIINEDESDMSNQFVLKPFVPQSTVAIVTNSTTTTTTTTTTTATSTTSTTTTSSTTTSTSTTNLSSTSSVLQSNINLNPDTNNEQEELTANQKSDLKVLPSSTNSPLLSKRKIQLLNPQIIHPIKIPSCIQDLQRKNFKIISSNGRLFIKSNDKGDFIPASPTLCAKTTQSVPNQKNPVTLTNQPQVISGFNPSISSPIQTTILSNRLALQKLKIIPKISKQQITVSKSSNQIYVHTSIANNTSTVSSKLYKSRNYKIGNVPQFGSIIINKSKLENSGSSISVPPIGTKVITSLNTKLSSNNIISLSPSSSQNNVMVIGSVSSTNAKNVKVISNQNSNNSNNPDNIITEDTPIYIITAPDTNLEKSSSININCSNNKSIITTTEKNNFVQQKAKQPIHIISDEILQPSQTHKNFDSGVEDDKDEMEITEQNEENIKYGNEEKIFNDEMDVDVDVDVDVDANTDHKIKNDESTFTDNKTEIIYEETDWEDVINQEAIIKKDLKSHNKEITATNCYNAHNRTHNRTLSDYDHYSNFCVYDNYENIIEMDEVEFIDYDNKNHQIQIL